VQTSKASRLDSNANEESVELSSLSNLTGFPVDYIKSELIFDNDKITLSDLRITMVSYLESINNDD
jgi:hypothetical protein